MTGLLNADYKPEIFTFYPYIFLHLHRTSICGQKDRVDRLVQQIDEVLGVELCLARRLQEQGVDLAVLLALHDLVDEVLHGHVHELRRRHLHVLVHQRRRKTSTPE